MEQKQRKTSKWTVLWYTLLVCILYPLSTLAQRRINGTVTNTNNQPIVGASVTIQKTIDSAKIIRGFTFTDAYGKFTIQLPSPDSFLLVVESQSYLSFRQAFFGGTSDTLQLGITMPNAVGYLDTVKIVSYFKIREVGDTLMFNPSAFSSKTERNIEELIAKIPGFNIQPGGVITFNGNPISALLVDGANIFKADYSQFLENVSTDVLDRIDVIKNYNEDPILKEFNVGNGQVLNLKLKKSFKNAFGYLGAGAGPRKERLGELFAVKFNKKLKFQLGGNYNTLSNPSVNFSNLILPTQKNVIAAAYPYAQQASQLLIDRYYQQRLPVAYQYINRTGKVFGNLLYKTKKWELSTGVQYSRDSIFQRQFLTIDYLDGIRIQRLNNRAEEINALMLSNSVLFSGKTLSFSLHGVIDAAVYNPDINSTLNGDTTTKQKSIQMIQKYLFVFSLNKKISSKLLLSSGLTISKQNGDERLRIVPDIAFWNFPADSNLYKLSSSLLATWWQNAAGLKLSRNYRTWQQVADVGVFYNVLDKSNQLNGEPYSSTTKRTFFSNLNSLYTTGFWANYTAQKKISEKLGLSAQVLMKPTYVGTSDSMVKTRFDYFLYDYSLALSTGVNRSKVDISMGMQRSLFDPQLYYTSPVMTGYRILQQGVNRPYPISKIYSALSGAFLNFRNGITSFFTLNYSQIRDEYIPEVTSSAFSTSMSYRKQSVSLPQVFLISSLQKYFTGFPVTLNVAYFGNWQKRISYLNGSKINSSLFGHQATLGFRTNFKSWINVECSSGLNLNRNVPAEQNLDIQEVVMFEQKASVNFAFGKQIRMALSGNYFALRSLSGFSYFFADAFISYSNKGNKWLIEANARNLLNIDVLTNQTITPGFIQTDVINLPGRQLYLKLRLNFR